MFACSVASSARFAALCGTLLLTGALAGCTSDPAENTLAISLRTDLLPGEEFEAVTVTLGDGELSSTFDHRTRLDEDYLRGVRLGEDRVPPGETSVRVQLFRGGEQVVERTVSVTVASDLTVATIVITRDCRGVMCPGDGNPLFESCLGGTCVDPRCTIETPEYCPVACTVDTECSSEVPCIVPSCQSGTCFFVADGGRCGAGEMCDAELGCVGRRPDAGTDAAVDAMSDAGNDAGPGDAGMDVGMDAGDDAGSACDDRMQNGAETGVDCGGGCPPCDRCGSYSGELLCSGFEDPTFDEFLSVTMTNGGAIGQEPTRVHRGTASGRATGTIGASRAYWRHRVPEMSSGDVYARFYLYIAPSTDIGATRHIFSFRTESAGQRNLHLAILTNGKFELSSSGTFAATDLGDAVESRWMCIQFHANIAVSGLMEVAIDGRNHSLSTDTAIRDIGYREIRLGMTDHFGEPNVGEFYFDEFVMATEPIPCD